MATVLRKQGDVRTHERNTKNDPSTRTKMARKRTTARTYTANNTLVSSLTLSCSAGHTPTLHCKYSSSRRNQEPSQFDHHRRNRASKKHDLTEATRSTYNPLPH